MAQSRRFAGTVFRSFSHVFNVHFPRPCTCVFRRDFGSTKLFVGGLSFRTDEDGLRNAFSGHGEVSDVRVISDRETGRSRGFGFVTFISEEEAETALSKMDGKVLDGRVIRVDRASARTPAPRPFGNMGFDVASRSSSDSSPPAAETNWGSIPSLHAEVPQNASISSDADITFESSSYITSSGRNDSVAEEALPRINAIFDSATAGNSSSDGSVSVKQASTTVLVGSPPVDNPSSSSSVLADDGDESSSDATASEIKNAPSTSGSSRLDISSFPSFDDINFDDSPPLPRRKLRPKLPPLSQNFSPSAESRSLFGGDGEFDSAIPKPKGPEFDFGLTDISDTPPPTRPGERPQGGFDIRIPPGSLRYDVASTMPVPRPPGFSIFPPKIAFNPDFLYDTPEADNWSDVCTDPPKLYLASSYSPLRNFVSKDKELHWDPFDFDEDAKLSSEPEASVGS